MDGDKPDRKTFKRYPIGYFHIDIAEVQTAAGKLYLFVAIDRTSKFAYVELHQRATKMIAAEFLRDLIAAVPYAIHIVLTDNVLDQEAKLGLWPAGLDAGVCTRHPALVNPGGFHRAGRALCHSKHRVQRSCRGPNRP